MQRKINPLCLLISWLPMFGITQCSIALRFFLLISRKTLLLPRFPSSCRRSFFFYIHFVLLSKDNTQTIDILIWPIFETKCCWKNTRKVHGWERPWRGEQTMFHFARFHFSPLPSRSGPHPKLFFFLLFLFVLFLFTFRDNTKSSDEFDSMFVTRTHTLAHTRSLRSFCHWNEIFEEGTNEINKCLPCGSDNVFIEFISIMAV